MYNNLQLMIKSFQTPAPDISVAAQREEIVKEQNLGRMLPQQYILQPTDEQGLANKEDSPKD